MGRFSTDSFYRRWRYNACGAPSPSEKKRVFPIVRRVVSPKIKKGKGVESDLHNLLANELHSSWKEEDHEVDRRVVSGACKATAIQSSPKKSYHFFHP